MIALYPARKILHIWKRGSPQTAPDDDATTAILC